MKEIAQILLQVESTSSKKEKEAILALHKDNTLLKEVLNQIFNPFIKTGMAKKKLEKKVKMICTTIISADHDYIHYLQNRCSGKDADIVNIQYFISQQPEELRWLYEAMAIKTLKFGFTESTINKAFGFNFLPTFDLMLAEKYIETKKIKGVAKIYNHWERYIGKRVIATKKLDGNRVAVFVRDGGKVELYSREGHVLEGFGEIEKTFSLFPIGYVYDGELIATNEEGLNSQELFKKTSSIVKKKGEKVGLEFHAFDLLPIEEFEKGGFDMACEKRKDALGRLINMQRNTVQNCQLVHYVTPLYIGDFDYDLMEKFASEAKENQEEGIMVQLADAPYECKRTFGILKVKAFESADIRCLDMYEGKSGKNIGRLGGLILDFKGHRVNIGGGYSDEQRNEIWANPSLVIGKIIEIKYFEESVDENGDLDLRFGTFKTIRDDKTEPSYK